MLRKEMLLRALRRALLPMRDAAPRQFCYAASFAATC